MKQCPIDFFDPEVQHLAASAGCRLYRMQNDTGEGLISEYPILSGIDLFYNDFHMKDGQNQNKRPMPDTIEINHCREGRFECEFQNGDYQYIGAGDLSIHRLSHTTRQTRFPLAHYHGISITIDLPRAQQTLSSLEAIMAILISIWKPSPSVSAGKRAAMCCAATGKSRTFSRSCMPPHRNGWHTT